MFKGFLRRNPSIAERYADPINKARATVTEPEIRNWFQELYEYLQAEDCLDILKEPRRIFNSDESGFQTCPATGKVLGPVSYNNFYEIKTGKDKEQLTVMATFNAAGETISGMIVFPLQRISRDIAQNVPDDWGIGRSKKGWMRGSTYYEYIGNVFILWIKKENVKLPVLLLIDGHKSHLTLEVSKLCLENKIHHFALYPNATHILQPADVVVFRPLKVRWRGIVQDWKTKTGHKVVTKGVFGPLIDNAFKKGATPEVIKNGFRKCRLFPFDPNAVDYGRCMDSTDRQCPTRRVVEDDHKPVNVQTLLYVESLFQKGRPEEFRKVQGVEWEGDIEARELFQFWKKLRSKCLNETLTNCMLSESVEEEPEFATDDDLTYVRCVDTIDYATQSPSRQIDASEMDPHNFDDLPAALDDPAIDYSTPGPSQQMDVLKTDPHNFDDSPAATDTLHFIIDSVTPATKNPRNAKQEVSPAFADAILWPHESPHKNKNSKATTTVRDNVKTMDKVF